MAPPRLLLLLAVLPLASAFTVLAPQQGHALTMRATAGGAEKSRSVLKSLRSVRRRRAVQGWSSSGSKGRENRLSASATDGPKGAGGLNKWDPSSQQAWIQPALHNKNPVRLFLIGLALVASTGGGAELVGAKSAAPMFLHLVALSAWLGSSLWTTFIAGITMFKTLPRQMFGKVQSRLFPLYFVLNATAIGMMMVTTLPKLPLRSSAGWCLTISLVSNILNLLVFEPMNTDVMFKRYEIENNGDKNTDEYRKLVKQFGSLHGASSMLNLGALIGAVGYVWKLAQSLPIPAA